MTTLLRVPRSLRRFHSLAVCFGALVLFSDSPTAAKAAPDDRRLVVVLYPDDTAGSPAVNAADRGIRATFATESPGYVEVRNEYVDLSRSQGPEIEQLQRGYLRRKYAGRKVDLVIATLSSSLDFALESRAELFPGSPVVWCAVDEREIAARRLPPDVIGVPIRVDLTATLDTALRMHPGTRRVFVVAGKSPFDAAWEAEARRAFRPAEDRLEFVYLTGLTIDDLLTRVADLPERSVIYYLHVFQDGSGKTFAPADVLELLSRKANAPIYGDSDAYVGRGAVGGRVIRFDAEGTSAARLGLRILAGERPETIPVPAANANADMFDWRELRRWGIREGALPPGSVVRHKSPDFWDVYRWHVIGGVSLCAVETLLVAGLLVQRAKRRRADARFLQVVETAPSGMLLVGRDGGIVMANALAEALFGYGRGELLHQSVEVLVPEWPRDRHPSHRDRFFAAPEVRSIRGGPDLFGRRKDGSEFPVQIGLSPLQTARGLFVLASVIDLTARRRAEGELEASQRELKLLTGRLLKAQEDERRRIARELHDDVNQTLALLAVEMELVAAAPPGSPARAGDRVRDLSARLKELSSSVHDLSHQLHPSKLEHLGLVAAVCGLCKELQHSHDLDVQFIHHPEPARLPHDTALCLYRVAQEALRNVVKHSGSRRAAVELSGGADAVRLCVADEGAGFDPGSAACGLGLVSMRERLHLVGGEITIDSRPLGGTRISVRVPLAAPGPDGVPAARETEPSEPPADPTLETTP